MPDSPETSQSQGSPLYLVDPETKRDTHNNDLSYDEGEEHSFPARFLVMEHEAMQQITMSCLLPDSPKPFQRNLHIFQIQAPNMIHMIMVFLQSIIPQN